MEASRARPVDSGDRAARRSPAASIKRGDRPREVASGLGRRDGGKPNGQDEQSPGGVVAVAGEDGGDDLVGGVSPAASGMRGGGPGARRVDRADDQPAAVGLRGEHRGERIVPAEGKERSEGEGEGKRPGPAAA